MPDPSQQDRAQANKPQTDISENIAGQYIKLALPFDVRRQAEVGTSQIVAELRAALPSVFPATKVTMEAGPTGNGAMSEVYRGEIGDQGVKFKVVGPLMFLALTPRPEPASDQFDALANLRTEIDVLAGEHNSPYLSRLLAVIYDTPRGKEEPIPLALIEEWIDGVGVVEAVKSELITRADAYSLVVGAVRGLADQGMLLKDPRIDNFVLELGTGGEISGVRLIDANVLAIYSTDPEDPRDPEALPHILRGLGRHLVSSLKSQRAA